MPGQNGLSWSRKKYDLYGCALRARGVVKCDLAVMKEGRGTDTSPFVKNVGKDTHTPKTRNERYHISQA